MSHIKYTVIVLCVAIYITRVCARAPGNPRQVFPGPNRSIKKLLKSEFTPGQAAVGWGMALWRSLEVLKWSLVVYSGLEWFLVVSSAPPAVSGHL